ncbi:MAG TPA: peptidase MA family metallohydrolase, partial [Anaerolineales bacterium]|nr:peptidase MA family metallohydrolase [Anaerolineales bacterium]
WHDRSASFGQGVFDIAVRAVRDQQDVFQVDLEYPVRIVIYNSFQEYAEFQGIAHEWVGGQTYSDYGVTVQIVENSTYQNSWLLDVIPHEISHLYFAQAAHNPTVSIPTWLNEGVAQYNEYTDHVWEANNVRSAAKRGELIPLSLLANGFGAYNEERIYLAYNESWSAVNYFAETYGEASLGVLLAAYKQGKMTDEAFLAAIGKDAGAFETEWAQYLGVPDDYVTPTPWALPTFRSAPTMFVRGQTAATQEPTVEPVFTPTALPDDPTPSQTNFPCVSFAPALALGLGVVIYRQKRQPK